MAFDLFHLASPQQKRGLSLADIIGAAGGLAAGAGQGIANYAGQAQEAGQNAAAGGALRAMAGGGQPPPPMAPPAGMGGATPPTPGGGLTPSLVQQIIQQNASPQNAPAMLATAQAEGGMRNATGDSGSSFSPFQMHYGGMAGGGNRVPGLGDTYQRETGQTRQDIQTPEGLARLTKWLSDHWQQYGTPQTFHAQNTPAYQQALQKFQGGGGATPGAAPQQAQQAQQPSYQRYAQQILQTNPNISNTDFAMVMQKLHPYMQMDAQTVENDWKHRLKEQELQDREARTAMQERHNMEMAQLGYYKTDVAAAGKEADRALKEKQGSTSAALGSRKLDIEEKKLGEKGREFDVTAAGKTAAREMKAEQFAQTMAGKEADRELKRYGINVSTDAKMAAIAQRETAANIAAELKKRGLDDAAANKAADRIERAREADQRAAGAAEGRADTRSYRAGLADRQQQRLDQQAVAEAHKAEQKQLDRQVKERQFAASLQQRMDVAKAHANTAEATLALARQREQRLQSGLESRTQARQTQLGISQQNAATASARLGDKEAQDQLKNDRAAVKQSIDVLNKTLDEIVKMQSSGTVDEKTMAQFGNVQQLMQKRDELLQQYQAMGKGVSQPAAVAPAQPRGYGGAQAAPQPAQQPPAQQKTLRYNPATGEIE